jgi:nucleoside phosphorylase
VALPVPPEAKLGVVTGLRSEARLLRGLDIPCISIGGRAEGAADKISRFISSGVSGLVSFGIAGALHPDLRAGDVVIGTAIVGPAGDLRRADDHWLNEVAPASVYGERDWRVAAIEDGQSAGALLGLDTLLSSPAEKKAAFARTGALAVDMESHHVARAAAAHGLPFIAIRAISDQASEVLPAVFASFVTPEGATKMSAVFAALISGRVKLRDLLAAGRSSRKAHQALFGCRGAVARLR